jgi:hypothetical protein
MHKNYRNTWTAEILKTDFKDAKCPEHSLRFDVILRRRL